MADYDLIVIGSGPSGRRAAIQAAKLGKTVLVVDKRAEVGGVSVHTGTIPSKTMRETVLNLTGWRERGFYGRAYRVKKDITAADLLLDPIGAAIEAALAPAGQVQHRFAQGF